jgi:hypothetical protein
MKDIQPKPLYPNLAACVTKRYAKPGAQRTLLQNWQSIMEVGKNGLIKGHLALNNAVGRVDSSSAGRRSQYIEANTETAPVSGGCCGGYTTKRAIFEKFMCCALIKCQVEIQKCPRHE